MEIKFQGQYDRTTFFKSVSLANKPIGNQGRYLVIMLVFSLGVLGIIAYRVFRTGDFKGNAILLAAALALGCIVAWVNLGPYFTARKLWANPGTRRPLEGQVTNRGITYVLQEGSNEIRWERIQRVRKTVGIVTMVRDDGLLLIFLRRFFKRDADWRKFVKLVDSKTVTAK